MVFKFGTGWLGWSPEQTLDTPMPQLFLALEGKIDFLKKTNPFGGGGGGGEKKEADPAVIAKHQAALDVLNSKAKIKLGTIKRE